MEHINCSTKQSDSSTEHLHTYTNIPDSVSTYWAVMKVKENISEVCSHPLGLASEGHVGTHLVYPLSLPEFVR